MSTKLVAYSASEHLSDLVDLLEKLQLVDDSYPPRVGEKLSRNQIERWFEQGPDIERWVAMRSGAVVGHIAVCSLHDYLRSFLDCSRSEKINPRIFCEITQFFVSPTSQRSGVGELLFEAALKYAQSARLSPVLAVIEGSLAARRFYVDHGLTELGAFVGIHGTNYVFGV